MMDSPQIFRLYLASLPGDMDGERAVIEGMVLPELRALAAKVGIETTSVYPIEIPDEAWYSVSSIKNSAGVC